MKRLLLAAALLFVVPALAIAQDRQTADALESWTTAQKRTWLRSQIDMRLADPDQLRDAVAALQRMSPDEIDALLAASMNQQSQQSQLAAAQARLAQERAYRDRLVREYQARLAASRGAGFRPVITTLPSGASLSAGAVVSPDRRYVRINAMPFFSNVGPVHTFNFRNGHTNRIFLPHEQRQQEPVRYYHDGLRMRVGR